MLAREWCTCGREWGGSVEPTCSVKPQRLGGGIACRRDPLQREVFTDYGYSYTAKRSSHLLEKIFTPIAPHDPYTTQCACGGCDTMNILHLHTLGSAPVTRMCDPCVCVCLEVIPAMAAVTGQATARKYCRVRMCV